MNVRVIKSIVYLLIGLGLLVLLGNKLQIGRTDQIISPLGTGQIIASNLTSKTLGGAVLNALDGTKGIYGVSIKNLRTGESFVYNDHIQFDTGSLYKLWIMAVAYDQISNGVISEDEVLSYDIGELNKKFEIDEDEAEFSEGTFNFSVKQAIHQMITISHNYAALMLTDKVKLSQVQKFLEDHNYSESEVGGTPKTSASDMALFLEDLYTGKLNDPATTTAMLDLLKGQQLNNKIPKYLPKEQVIAHKTGEIGYFSHDAGIVLTPKGDYIIVVLSQSDLPAAAEDRIAQISKNVFDYYQLENK